MAERFLQLDITKMLGTTLFLCVDKDEATMYAVFDVNSSKMYED